MIISMDVSHHKSSTVVQAENLVNGVVEFFLFHIYHGHGSAVVQCFGNGSHEWNLVYKHDVNA